MTATDLDVVAIGNAIVDVLAHADDAFVAQRGLVKNTMALIDEDQAEALYAAMGPAVEVSGGAAANTAAGVASFGAAAAFVGKVRDDVLGQVFAHDIRAAGVRYQTPMAAEGPATARSLIIVTPDAHRTMNTFLGASVRLREPDIDVGLVQSAAVTLVEGYLWDAADAVPALSLAMRSARDAGRQVALALSDPFCVERHRDEFLDLLDGDVDIVFANEHEAEALFKGASLDDAVAELRRRCRVVAVTQGPAGSIVAVDGDGPVHVDAAPVKEVVDTTGAGDLYAAGFLVGLVRGLSATECGRLGGLAAAEVISHVGARPVASLAALLQDAG
jgi:sugar/nucleoside kinase (ribokinase family)